MTVYVDDMQRPATVGRISARWSHMLADTTEELHEFADRLGLNRAWVQYPGTHREHYDLTEKRRREALRLGAVAIGYPSGTGQVLARKRASA